MNRRATHTPETGRSPERFDRGVWASVALHGVLAILLVTSPSLFPDLGDAWGGESGGSGGISVQLVSSLSGVPLPSPAFVSPDAVGNDSPGFYEPDPAPPARPPETPADAEPIPEVFEVAEAAPDVPVPVPAPPAAAPAAPVVEAPPAPPSPTPAREDRAPAPDNAVPFGEGGQPDVSSGFSSDQGAGGLDIGDGAFGQQYGAYVRGMTRRISDNWFQGMVDANVGSGRRVTLSFDILRDGRIDGIRVVESSGNASLDTSAQRALLRSSPLPPLPLSYRGSSVGVRFWFEFRR